ncbi:NlpC/P60 family protein [Thermomonas aquatica]|jgi:cell wall-associated NlpC family hydrolase|uniref:NlpC/P60 family protein n=2 Tax=Thermomonas aquatica TaxID=2202149 RepID=A0A5B7ZTE1_9GAMM|nr:NlpC/P60 family protein [Thermomonas aquatica]
MAFNPVELPADAATTATLAPLDAVAPVDLASPDNAPLAAQIAVLQQAQASPSTSSRIKTVLQRAFALLGTPYRWGGTSPERGFDCSGLVGYVFRSIGVDLPRVSRAMAHEGTAITDRSALAEGDLVFFGKRGKVDHVGIYIGEGKFLHAPRTGRDVTVSTLSTGYWSQKYLEARRLATGS